MPWQPPWRFSGPSRPSPGRRPDRSRSGSASTPARPSFRDGDYYGSAVNRCARLRGIGHGGQVLLSEATAVLVHEAIPIGAGLLDLGQHRLKDLTQPEQVFQVVAPDRASSFPALVSLDARPHNLPTHPTAQLGLAPELAEGRKLIEDGARRHLEESLAMARSMGHVWGTANSLRMLGRLTLQEGKLDRAAALIEESLPFLSTMGDLRTTRQLLWDLGQIALADQDPRRAGARFCESLKLSLEASVRREIPRCVDGLVVASMQMASSAPRSTRAAWLLGASATMRENYGPAIHGDEQPLLDQAVAATRSSLGEQAYDVAQSEGRSLSFGRAIELALALAAEIQAADL